MIEISGERWIAASCEQIWMLVDEDVCRARWLSFNDRITEVTVHEHSRRVGWNTQDHPRTPGPQCTSCLTIELIPEGAGTRVRILATREPLGRLGALAMKVVSQRACERDINRSLSQLAGMLGGR